MKIPESTRNTTADVVKCLSRNGTFLGGPLKSFELAGNCQLGILLHFGLTPESKVLDVGCGCLRGGRKIIPELNEACYFGIEPNKSMLKDGIEISLDPDVVLAKKPRFDTNAEWNFGVFNTKFDFVIARSIWSHASKRDITKMLEEFSKWKKPGAKFITSYHRAAIPIFGDYHGNVWVGKSHVSDKSGAVRHSLLWIQMLCEERGLTVREVSSNKYDFGTQKWLVIEQQNGRKYFSYGNIARFLFFLLTIYIWIL